MGSRFKLFALFKLEEKVDLASPKNYTLIYDNKSN